MENASKALLMAGSVLIAIIIISCLVLMINNLTSYQKTVTSNDETSQITEFNNQFTKYITGNTIRGNELISLMNKVVDYNKRYSIEGTETDNGQYVGYKDMEIDIDLGDDLSVFYYDTEYTDPDGGDGRLIDKTSYVASKKKNTLEDLYTEITNIESMTYKDEWGIMNETLILNSELLNKFVVAIDIFSEDRNKYGYNIELNTKYEKMIEAIEKFDKICGGIVNTEYYSDYYNIRLRYYY